MVSRGRGRMKANVAKVDEDAQRRSDMSWRLYLAGVRRWPFPVPVGGFEGVVIPAGVSCAMCGGTDCFERLPKAWSCRICRPNTDHMRRPVGVD